MKASFANKHAPQSQGQSEADAQATSRGAPEAERGVSAGMPLFLEQTLAGPGGAGLLQPKLIVGQPKDVYEREADRVAAQVAGGGAASSPRAPAISRAPRAVQRCAACAAGKPCAKCQAEQGLIQRQPASEAELEDGTLPAAVLQRLGAGQPLDPTARALMESRFGQSFSDVQVHADPGSAAVAAHLRAHAFTVGQHIYFGSDRYQPQTSAGQHLLAHELTHTVQQRSVGPVAPQTPLGISRPAERGEREAGRVATSGRSTRRGPAQISAAPAAALIQRYSWDEFKSDAAGAAGAVYDVGAGAVEAGAELVGEGVEYLVRQVAPELADLIAEGPFEYFKRYIEGMIGDWLPSLFGDLSVGEIIDGFVSGLSEAFALVQGILQGDAASCQAFSDILGALRDLATSLIDNPLVAALKDIFGAISDTIGTVVKFVLAPAFDVLKDVLGGAWEAIKSVASTIWGWISDVRELAGEALDWVMEQLGLNDSSSEDGIFAWIKRQAGKIWDTIKETFAPVAGPIKTVLTIMVALSPIGPVYFVIKYAPKLVEAVQWLWAHKDDPDIIRSAHEQMGNTILPQLLETIAGFRDVLAGAASWLLETLSSLAASALELLGGVTGVPLLSMAQDFVQMLVDGVNSLLAWGQGAFQSIVTTIQEVGQKIWSFVEPYKEVLTSIALAIINPPMIPVILAGWAWTLLPSCIKVPIIDFFLDILIEALDALPELALFGPLWPMLRAGVLGFFRRVRSKSPEVKERISNKIARIMSGQSPAFLIGFAKGFLQGIWEGITDPLMMVWMVIEGLSYAQNYLEKLAAETLGLSPTQATPAAATASATASAAPAASGRVSAPAASAAAAPSTAAPATTTAGAAAPAVDQGLGARVGEMAQELEPPVTEVTDNFWSGVTEYFNSGEGMTFDGLVTKLGEAWDSLLGKIGEAGGELADKAVEFLDSDGAEGEMGSAVGWLAGNIAFEVLLDVITAGIWAATGPVAKAIQKFLTKVQEVIDEVFKLFRKLGSFLLDGVKKLGKMISEAAGGALKVVKEALGEIAEKLMAYADEIIGRFGSRAGKAEQKLAAEAEQKLATEAQQKLAAEAEQKLAAEARQKGATELGQTAEQKTAQEAQQHAAAEAEQKTAKEGKQKAASEAEQKAAELPAALAQARAIEAAMDVEDLPVPVLIGALESSLMPRYTWINSFRAERQGNHHNIFLIASKEFVGEYTEGTTTTPGEESKPKADEGTPKADEGTTAKPDEQAGGKGRRTVPERNRSALPEGESRTGKDLEQARSYFNNHKDEAIARWEKQTGQTWPIDPGTGKPARASHTRPLADGGDPMVVEPAFGDPNTEHLIPDPKHGGLTDQQRYGARGGNPGGPRKPVPERNRSALPQGETRTPDDVQQARNYFKNHRDEAIARWEKETGQTWPIDPGTGKPARASHTRPLADGGDPMVVEPAFGDPNTEHIIPDPKHGGLTDKQRYGGRRRPKP